MRKVLLAILAIAVALAAHAGLADVNHDGAVTAADITAVYDVMLGNNTSYLITADVNRDGAVTAADITLIYNVMLGIESDPEPQQRVVVAYCPYYAGNRLPDPFIVTHINYAFAEVYVRNGVYQSFELQDDGNTGILRQLVAFKHDNPDLKICLSFSHTVSNSDNYQDGGFSAIAATDDNRRRFAQDCLAFCQQWGIDGIDIDWEFPGLSWSGAACNPAVDTQNHVLLMKQLRETLGNRYLLTFAGYVKDKQPTAGGYKFIDLAAVEPYVNFVNLMTYDMDAAPHFHSAINHPASYWDCQRAINAYAAAGFPMNKIVLGIPFYMRHAWDGANSVIDYRRLSSLPSEYNIDNWSDAAQTPYVTLNGVFFGSYDNSRSITIKGQWAREKGLRGLMYWECSEDDDNRTLANAIWNAVMGR
ncbi:MAG: glycoside hydrolase family 18 [Muribaculaceae bacterium]|nr:glycoside hydrolase family 18 [Muribaculaceae bacterium]